MAEVRVNHHREEATGLEAVEVIVWDGGRLRTLLFGVLRFDGKGGGMMSGNDIVIRNASWSRHPTTKAHSVLGQVVSVVQWATWGGGA